MGIDGPGAAAKLGGMSWNQSPAASARVRVACGALVILGLGVVLSFTAFYEVCTGFRFWDDMGYIMLTQKTLASGHPLYDQTYTQYGPAYYAWKQVLHGVTRLPLSHDSTAVFTAASWVAAALLGAGYVARMTRRVFLTALTGLSVFYLLNVLQYGARSSAGTLRGAAGGDVILVVVSDEGPSYGGSAGRHWLPGRPAGNDQGEPGGVCGCGGVDEPGQPDCGTDASEGPARLRGAGRGGAAGAPDAQ